MSAGDGQTLRGGALLVALDAEIAAHEASLEQLRAMRQAAVELPTAVVVEISAARAPIAEDPDVVEQLEPPQVAPGEVRICDQPGCDETFEPRTYNQRYCSTRCRENPEPQGFSERECGVCGESFIPEAPRALYCSDSCRDEKTREQKREQKRRRREQDEAAAAPPSAVPAPSVAGSRAAGERNRQAVLAALEAGECTQAELIQRSGVPAGSISSVVERLARRGVVVVRREARRRLISLRVGAVPAGPAAAEPTAAERATERRNAKRAAEADEFKQHVRELLKREGPLTAEEIHEHLNEPPAKGRLLNVLQRTAGIQNSLLERNGRALWEAVPLPAEQESVTISHGTPGSDPVLAVRLINLLAERPMRIGDLAVELGGSHAAIASEVSLLERAGQLVKQPGGVYMFTRREEAHAA